MKRALEPRFSIRAVSHLVLVGSAILLFFPRPAQGQVGACTKPAVGDHIRKVEDGVDEFRKYLERRGEDAKNRTATAQSSTTKTRRGRTGGANTEARKEQAKQTKDELDDALGDLNRSTNRLRRKFTPASNYMETRAQMDRVMDDGRRINQIMVRGNYGTQGEKYWGVLRAAINDLARCYGLTPMGV
jgi:multidrug efflux pump subunit AcrB